MMENNYEILYRRIVKDGIMPKYSAPEEQGRRIQRCSILKSTEIEYGSSNTVKGKQIE